MAEPRLALVVLPARRLEQCLDLRLQRLLPRAHLTSAGLVEQCFVLRV